MLYYSAGFKFLIMLILCDFIVHVDSSYCLTPTTNGQAAEDITTFNGMSQC